MDHLNLQEREFHFTKLVKAPAERVFEAWTDPLMLSKWWGADEVEIGRCEVDPRQEGEIYIETKAKDQKSYPMIGTIYEIVPSSALIFNLTVIDEKGEILVSSLNTIEFSYENEETLLEVSVQILKASTVAKPYLDAMEEGWEHSLDQLKKVLVDPELNLVN